MSEGMVYDVFSSLSSLSRDRLRQSDMMYDDIAYHITVNTKGAALASLTDTVASPARINI